MFELNYYKSKRPNLETLEKQWVSTNDEAGIEYHPFSISDLQQYNPIYKNFFEMSEKNFNKISLNNRYQIIDLQTVYDISDNCVIEKPIFIKFAPLLDPLRYLVGKYTESPNILRSLPKINSTEEQCSPKLLNIYNCSYIDNFFCYLSSQLLNTHGVVNACNYYGSYLGIQEKYKFMISDDIQYVSQFPFFQNNMGKLYEIAGYQNPFATSGSRNHKQVLEFEDEPVELELDVLEDIETVEDLSNDVGEIEQMYHCDELENENEMTIQTPELIEDEDSDENSEESNSDSDVMSFESDNSNMDEENVDMEQEDEDDDDDDEEDDEDDDDEDDDDEMYCYIKNFPVQLICLEKCDGTVDELFVKDLFSEESVIAMFFQIIMTLLIYQKTFHFTHNDLHTNNIMYSNTDLEYLYYKFNNQVWKVPTYGRIYKIIDYGRAIYKFAGKTYCSDSFAPGGDAHTQYNFEPFFNSSKARLEPNYAFDLCRLGCSMFDFLLDSEMYHDPKYVKKLDNIQKLVLEWTTDDQGKNIVYKKNGDERYPYFKLYKMIARLVHKHTPIAQLDNPIFSDYKISSRNVSPDQKLMDIDKLPCYA